MGSSVYIFVTVDILANLSKTPQFERKYVKCQNVIKNCNLCPSELKRSNKKLVMICGILHAKSVCIKYKLMGPRPHSDSWQKCDHSNRDNKSLTKAFLDKQ